MNRSLLLNIMLPFRVIHIQVQVNNNNSHDFRLDFTFILYFTGGNTKQEAKKEAAMVANIAMFGLNYSYPIPTPKFPCEISITFDEYEEMDQLVFRFLQRTSTDS